jgi:hypothetical protein
VDWINCDLGQGEVAGFCEHSNEPQGSIFMQKICRLSENVITFEEGLLCLELYKFSLPIYIIKENVCVHVYICVCVWLW